MSSHIDKIRNEALSLSVSERASLAHDLILRLETPSDFELDSKREKEIARRVQSIRKGSSKNRTASQVFADIRAKYVK